MSDEDDMNEVSKLPLVWNRCKQTKQRKRSNNVNIEVRKVRKEDIIFANNFSSQTKFLIATILCCLMFFVTSRMVFKLISPTSKPDDQLIYISIAVVTSVLAVIFTFFSIKYMDYEWSRFLFWIVLCAISSSLGYFLP